LIDEELHQGLSPDPEPQEKEGEPEPEELEPEMDSSVSEIFDFEPSDLLSFAVGEEVLSADSSSSPGSYGSSDDHNQDFSVVELVGILPQGVKVRASLTINTNNISRFLLCMAHLLEVLNFV